MSESLSTAAPLVVTPSERVLLFGDQFARPAGMLGDREEVLSSGVKVIADDLAEKMILAAFLACERAGAVRLEQRQGKAMFGLRRTSHLHLVPGMGVARWPDLSLESRVVQIAHREPTLENAARPLVGGEKSDQPALGMFARIKGELAARGVVAAERKRTLRLFTSVAYSLPPHVRDDLTPGLGGVGELLAACERQRPEVWIAMRRSIRSAIAGMTASGPD